ncbi:SDR family oxidoreductase [Methylobacterium oxalidis]|uniref:SDR family oxidoreductase n=1 Tax=Methylobacterium oxalidis TaxID=944322 RepID=UPI003315A5A0
METSARIAILGASGLIGQGLAEALGREGFAVTAIARRFTPAQAEAFGAGAIRCPVVDLGEPGLGALLAEHRPDLVVNCLGVLQDDPRGLIQDVHAAFVGRLLRSIAAQGRPILLVHVSIPGEPDEDETTFSRTKREAERLIADAACPSVILRPGFVIGPAAYGGSALIRALAAAPLDLPEAVAKRPFAATAMADIARAVSSVARRWQAGERDWHAVWDLLEECPSRVGTVIEAVRLRFGGPRPRLTLPAWLLSVGARLGDAAAVLGWSPPVRTTALREMMRGVRGDPGPFIAESGLRPATLPQILADLPPTIQERWFGGLYLLKPLVIGGLAVFWAVSGLIALIPAFDAAAAILTARGFPDGLARFITLVTSLADIAVGLAIAFRRTCRAGLVAGIALSLSYMAGAVILTPSLWIEPLGALVKTGPAIILILVALATLDER